MTVIVLIAIWFVLLFVWGWFKPKPQEPPIYPGALPLIGHAHLFIGDRKHFFKLLKKFFHYSLEKGGVIQCKMTLHTLYMITDPDDTLVLANTCLNKPYLYAFAKDFLKNGLITAQAVTWKKHRKLLNPAFRQQVLNTFLDELNIQSRWVVAQLDTEVGKQPFDCRPYLVNFALRIVSRTSLGLKPKDQALIDKDYKNILEHLLVLYVERGLRVWLHMSYLFNRSALKRKQDELVEKLQDIVNPVILKRKSDMKAIKNVDSSDPTSEKFVPLLDQMLSLSDSENGFTDEEIREHMDTFVLASYDTTSSTLKFILLLVGSHPEVQERIIQEIQEVLGTEDTDCTKDDLPKLVYLDAVIKETLRLYPTVATIARKVDQDLKLKNYTLRAGSTAFIGLYGINRHPMWGADAEVFRPERWLDPASLPDNPNAYAAFSVGKRSCIGKLYSMMVMKTALVHILRRFHVSSDISNLESQFDIVVQAVEGDLITLTHRT